MCKSAMVGNKCIPHSSGNSRSRSLILPPRPPMIDNGSLSNQAVCKSDGDLVTKGIKFSYKAVQLQQRSNVAIISSKSVTEVSSDDVCPSTFIESLAQSKGDNAQGIITQPLHQSEFIQPTVEQIEAYSHSTDAMGAVRANDVDRLRQLLACGAQFQVCNKFGESLLHMACRRSKGTVVSFLLHEANVSPRIRDDYGRTPLHDACWRGDPEYEIVEMLLRKEPRLAFVEDIRGHKPFQYARKEHWSAWKEFLGSKMDLMISKSP